ncbi:MAG: class I SAM-dependent methyltransferase [Anaerolineae bacterium]|nr:class I SAM-dependent methyltransferase [Anaerolineae bacterium]
MKRSSLTHGRIFDDELFAERYAERHRKMAEKFGDEYAEKLISRGFYKGRIIDVGCGFGGMNIVLARRFADSEIVGIDLSDPLLQLANRSAQAANLGDRVRFEKADVHQIPYDDNSFDVVINTNMAHLVDDPVQMLNEIERILVPDGCLFIADIRRSWIGLLDKTFKSALTLDEARELVDQSNVREGSFSSSLLWWRLEA